MGELRIGFVGAGGKARDHMKRVTEVQDVRITAVCDIDEGRAQEAAQPHKAAVYTDHHAMLDREEFGVLYVSVPPFAHTDAEILAAQKGLHVFVEKPVVLDTDKGLEICEALEQAGVITCVGYQLRYFETVQRAKRWLADKTIALVDSRRWGGLPGTAWWRVMEQSGGQLVEQTTHQVDLMRYLAGEIVQVYAQYALRCMGNIENFTIPDTQCVMFEFASGALGMCSTTPMMTAGGGKGELEFLVGEQRLAWSTNALQVIPGGDEELEKPVGAPPSIDEMFVRAIRSNDQSVVLSSYRDGLITCDVTLAANESAATGRPVRPRLAPQ